MGTEYGQSGTLVRILKTISSGNEEMPDTCKFLTFFEASFMLLTSPAFDTIYKSTEYADDAAASKRPAD